MKILVIGASQGTGALAVENALARGHEVTAFSRNPQKLVLEHPKLTRRPGNFHDRESVEAAVQGHEAVILTASATTLKSFKENPNYLSAGTALIIEAMKRHGVKKLAVLSALGVGETRNQLSWLMRMIMIDGLLKLPYADHERQEALVRGSGLEWVIARPSRLTNGPARNAYTKAADLERVPSAISRADVAAFLVDAVETNAWAQKAVSLGG